MAQVNVRIAGRLYRMACGDGEEEHLKGLAARLDSKIDELRGTFGEIGDNRITVMAALTLTDQLSESERRVIELDAENSRLRAEQASYDARTVALADALADALGDAAARIDRAAQALNARPREETSATAR